MNEIAEMIGVRPNLWRMCVTDPVLAAHCFFGPCLPAQYRLQGPGKWSKAKETIKATFNNTVSGTQTRRIVCNKNKTSDVLLNLLWCFLIFYTIFSVINLFI